MCEMATLRPDRHLTLTLLKSEVVSHLEFKVLLKIFNLSLEFSGHIIAHHIYVTELDICFFFVFFYI